MVDISTTAIQSKYKIRGAFSITVALALLLYIYSNTKQNLRLYIYNDILAVATAPTVTYTTFLGGNENGDHVQRIIVDRRESSFPKEQVQMCWEQVLSILKHLPEDGNLLVWGLGYDSVFWNTVTTGRVVFLEDGDMNTNLVPNPDLNESPVKKMVRWYDSMTYQHPQLQAYTVNYTTKNTLPQLEYYKSNKERWREQLYIDDLPHMLLYNTIWDVILIDAPLGYPTTGPGRFQSIYMTKIIANHSLTLSSKQQHQHGPERVVHVFVDDYERRVEREFSLAVFHPAVPEHVIPRPAYKQHVTPNEQAHFIISLSNMR